MSKRILVVDDEATIRLSLAEALAAEGTSWTPPRAAKRRWRAATAASTT